MLVPARFDDGGPRRVPMVLPRRRQSELTPAKSCQPLADWAVLSMSDGMSEGTSGAFEWDHQ